MSLPLGLDATALRVLLGGRFEQAPPPAGPFAFLAPASSVEAGEVSICWRPPPRAWLERSAALWIVADLAHAPADAALLVVPDAVAALRRLLEGPCAPPWEAEDWLDEPEVVSRFGAGARTAMVHRVARIAPGVGLGAGVVVHGGVEIGEGSRLEAGCVIGAPGFALVPDPDRGTVPLPHPAGVRIGRDVWIGAQGHVAAGLLEPTRLGDGVRLDAQVHVGHGASLGTGCVVAAQSGFGGSCRLGAGCRVGGGAAFADHVVLGEGCEIAALSGVTRSFPAGSRVAGFPAQPLALWRRSVARGRRTRLE